MMNGPTPPPMQYSYLQDYQTQPNGNNGLNMKSSGGNSSQNKATGNLVNLSNMNNNFSHSGAASIQQAQPPMHSLQISEKQEVRQP